MSLLNLLTFLKTELLLLQGYKKIKMCSSRKYPHSPHECKVTGNSKGEEVCKPKHFKGKCEVKLEFPEGLVQIKKNYCGRRRRGYGYFFGRKQKNTMLHHFDHLLMCRSRNPLWVSGRSYYCTLNYVSLSHSD